MRSSPTGTPDSGSIPSADHGARASRGERRADAAVCVFLVLAVALVFGQTVRHGFINHDDDRYVYENPVVLKGLTVDGVGWAFRYGEIGHWHPLTWLSHMLDCQLYGANAAGHHLTNVLLHAAASVLLFLTLRRMTRGLPGGGYGGAPRDASGKVSSLWPCAFAAAVFAVHPLRAESVAWIAERKDVLSGFFFMLTLWAYARYVAAGEQTPAGAKLGTKPDKKAPKAILRPAVSRSRGVWYALVLAFFALGLLSKNMLVTLPCVLLLLDFWPLRRIQLSDLRCRPSVPRRLVIEKAPLFMLSLLSSVMTSLMPETLAMVNKLPLTDRLANALISYLIYLGKMVCPTGLVIPYMYPAEAHSPWRAGVAA